MEQLRKDISIAISEHDRIWADGIKKAVEEAEKTGELKLVFLTDVAKGISANRGAIEQHFLDYEQRIKEKKKGKGLFKLGGK